MGKISEYEEISSIEYDANLIAETSTGSYKVPQLKLAKFVDKRSNKTYTDISAPLRWSPGSMTYDENGVLTITYLNNGGGGFFLTLYKGVDTIVRIKRHDTVAMSNWFIPFNSKFYVFNYNSPEWPGGIPGRMEQQGDYVIFTIPAAVEAAFGPNISMVTVKVINEPVQIVFSDIRIYPKKIVEPNYVAEFIAEGINGIDDVNIASPTNGQVMKWNAATQKWENANESGGGGGADELTDLNDVNITSPTNGQAMIYDAQTQKWKNANVLTETQVNSLIDTKINALGYAEQEAF